MLMGMGKQIRLIPVNQQLPDTPPETTPPSAYSRTERGEPVHNATDLINMSQKLQIPIQQLLPEAFSGDSNSPPNRPVSTGIALATAPGHNKHYSSLSEAAKELEASLKNLEAENAELKRKLAAR